MNIQEATKKAVAENKAIINLRDTTISFVPYAPNGCWWIVSNNDEVVKVSSKPALWNPTYHDFLSDDWAVGSQKIVLEKKYKTRKFKKVRELRSMGTSYGKLLWQMWDQFPKICLIVTSTITPFNKSRIKLLVELYILLKLMTK